MTEGPVFVDPTGRRARLVGRTCTALGVLISAYVALVVVSLVGPPGLSRLAVPGLGPVLPGPVAAPLDDGGDGAAPQTLLPTRAASPSATAQPVVLTRSTPTPSASARPTTTRGPAASPTVAPTRPTASATAAQTAGPTARPTATRTPPGRASAAPTPAASEQPPRSTRAPSPKPTPGRP